MTREWSNTVLIEPVDPANTSAGEPRSHRLAFVHVQNVGRNHTSETRPEGKSSYGKESTKTTIVSINSVFS